MKILFLLVAIAVIAIIIKVLMSRGQMAQESSAVQSDENPSVEKVNDKVIVVTNVNFNDIQKALKGVL